MRDVSNAAMNLYIAQLDGNASIEWLSSGKTCGALTRAVSFS